MGVCLTKGMADAEYLLLLQDEQKPEELVADLLCCIRATA